MVDIEASNLKLKPSTTMPHAETKTKVREPPKDLLDGSNWNRNRCNKDTNAQVHPTMEVKVRLGGWIADLEELD